MIDKETTLRIIGDELPKILGGAIDGKIGPATASKMIDDLLRRAYEAGVASRVPVDRHDLARLRAIILAAHDYLGVEPSLSEQAFVDDGYEPSVAALIVAAVAALPGLLDVAERLLQLEAALDPVKSEIEERAYADDDWLNVGMAVWPDFVSDDDGDEVTQERRL